MHHITAEMPDSFNLVLMGDTHEGAAAQHRSGLLETIAYIHDTPNTFGAHLGDWLEAITVDDKRYTVEETTEPIPLMQAYGAADAFRPIKDKMLAALWGNHEKTLQKYGNLVQHVICRELGIPYGGYLAKVELRHKGRQMFRLLLWHGSGSLTSKAKDPEQRRANKLAALKLKLYPLAADCAVMAMGHIHRLLTAAPSRELYLYTGGQGKVKQAYTDKSVRQVGEYLNPHQRWYCSTGSFLRGYVDGIDTYASVKGYPPVELGYCLLRVEDTKIVGLDEVVV